MGKLNIITLEDRKQECIKELGVVRELIDIYENSEADKNKLKYQRMRRKLGISQAELAKKANVSVSTVFHFENGINIRQINYDKIIKEIKE